jgi:glycosyltransferase involved in cell wall biosynthesis
VDRVPQISVIIPIFNEEPNIRPLHQKLVDHLMALGVAWEVVLVDDGSTDGSPALIDEIATSDGRFTAIHFRRNFGQTAAFAAGIRHARGEVIVPMDGDLQNDPADIQRLVAKLAEGFDVVSGWRRRRNDALSKRMPSRLANRMISSVTGVRLHDYGCSLKAYRREALEGVLLYGEMHRFIPVYAAMRGARVTEIEVRHYPRTGGKSTYGLERTGKVLLDLIVVKFFMSFMHKPIYLFGGMGILCFAAAAVCLLGAAALQLIPAGAEYFSFTHRYFFQTPLPALAVTLGAVGALMVLQGLVAEMVMRTYYESQGRDPYVIRKVTRVEHRTPAGTGSSPRP